MSTFAARRVVVTGLGVISPLGVGVAHVWSRLIAGASGIISLTGQDAPEHLRGRFDHLPSTIAGVVPRGPLAEGKYQADDWFDRKVSNTIVQYDTS
jgi:3-oxoacyl-[acyl-carrier-protein] synthase II